METGLIENSHYSSNPGGTLSLRQSCWPNTCLFFIFLVDNLNFKEYFFIERLELAAAPGIVCGSTAVGTSYSPCF
jgi:hypothetical protein